MSTDDGQGQGRGAQAAVDPLLLSCANKSSDDRSSLSADAVDGPSGESRRDDQRSRSVTAATKRVVDAVHRLSELSPMGSQERIDWWGRYLRIRECGQENVARFMSFECSNSSCAVRWSIASCQCGLKVCPRCTPVVAARQRLVLDESVRMMRDATPNGQRFQTRFVTLTLPSYPRGWLKQMIADLNASLQRFTRQAEFKRKVRGGFFVIEVKWGKRGWHAHAHGVLCGSFWRQRDFAASWLKACSKIECTNARPNPAAQHIEACRKPTASGRYLVNHYLTDPHKGLGAAALDDDLLMEWVEAWWGVRAVRTFGCCFGAKKRVVLAAKHVCPTCGAEARPLTGVTSNFAPMLSELLKVERSRAGPQP